MSQYAKRSLKSTLSITVHRVSSREISPCPIPQDYVLKPQREGGGNNIFRSAIPRVLKSFSDESHYKAYILMKLIKPPILHNCVVRLGQVSTRSGVVGELGVYGTILWDIRNGTILSNEQAGWILRTKETNSDEVGITAGFGSEDSVCLV